MSHNTKLNIDDFIIPDEEIESTPPSYSQNTNYSQGATSSSGNANNSNDNRPMFPWAPKIDLSSSFTPFMSSNTFSKSNKVKERQYSGGDTLDEPILETLKRDLFQIGRRLGIVIWPMQLSLLAMKQQLKLIDLATSNGIQLPQLVLNNRRISVLEDEDTMGLSNELADFDSLDWDLWGPLIFSLLFSVTLGFSAPNAQTNLVFSGSFAFIWLFFIIIGLNIQLLGGTISFMSAISAVGYAMFPIVLGSLLCSIFIKWKLIRLVLLVIFNSWSIYAGMMSLKCSGVLPGRVLLAIYPVALMYSVLSWLVIIN